MLKLILIADCLTDGIHCVTLNPWHTQKSEENKEKRPGWTPPPCGRGCSAALWSETVQQLPPDCLKFALNVAQDTLPPNANLSVWRRKEGLSSQCKLCGDRQTLSHVLNHCEVALELWRYNTKTWKWAWSDCWLCERPPPWVFRDHRWSPWPSLQFPSCHHLHWLVTRHCHMEQDTTISHPSITNLSATKQTTFRHNPKSQTNTRTWLTKGRPVGSQRKWLP